MHNFFGAQVAIAVMAVAFGLFLLLFVIAATRRTRGGREQDLQLPMRVRFIEEYPFPPQLVDKLIKKHPHLNREQAEKVIEALRDYFLVCLRGGAVHGNSIGMPSKIVDDAWHEFILFTSQYSIFCENAFGRFLHHSPHSSMTSPREVKDQMARAWHHSNRGRAAFTDPNAVATIPLLFAIDQMMNVSDGYQYQPEDFYEYERHHEQMRKREAAENDTSGDYSSAWFSGGDPDSHRHDGGHDHGHHHSDAHHSDVGSDAGASDGGGGGDAGGCGGGDGGGCGGGGCGGGGCGGGGN